MKLKKQFGRVWACFLMGSLWAVPPQGSCAGKESKVVPDLGNSEKLHAFLRERQALTGEMVAAVKRGGAPDQLAEWRAKNVGRFAALREQGKELAGKQGADPLPSPAEIRIPPSASPAMKEFLFAKDAWQRDSKAKQGVLRRTSGAEREQAFKAWRTESSRAQASLAKLAGKVAAEQPVTSTQPLAAPLVPDDVSPELRAFILDRRALMAERTALMAGNRSSSLEARHEAIKAWQLRNAARLKAVPPAVRAKNP